MSVAAKNRRRGTPLAVLALLIGGWVTGRAALWESPFALPAFPRAEAVFAGGEHQDTARGGDRSDLPARLTPSDASYVGNAAIAGSGSSILDAAVWMDYAALAQVPAFAAGHQYLLRAAFAASWHGKDIGALMGQRPDGADLVGLSTGASPPFAAPQFPARAGARDRWSLEAYAFHRAGSGGLSTSQGRVPVYGASQLAGSLQYRIAPSSAHDPRAYVRAYRALVSNPETEIAAGLSARPLRWLPVRLAGELRGTRNATGKDVRPAAYAVTEISPQRLPLDFTLEAYGGAGYVGGDAATYFLEGQAAATRTLATIDGVGDQPMRLSVGGAAWGGAQDDASRLDIGPSVRLDLTMGEVPARISVDWRERVAGDAAPESGLAATVSTRF